MKKSWKKKLLAGTLTTAILMTNSVTGFAGAAPDGQTEAENLSAAMGNTTEWETWKTEWDAVKTDWTKVSLTPGSNGSQLNFAWYSRKNASEAGTADTDSIGEKVNSILEREEDTTSEPELIIGEGAEMNNAQVYTAVQTDATTDSKNSIEYVSNKITATGLKENTSYYYSYELEDGTYSQPAEYKTGSGSSFSFIYVGDPQIGSSNPEKGEDTPAFYDAQSDSVRSDSFNWNATLNAAMQKSGNNASFVLSAGDQIQTTRKKSPNKDAAVSEIEYAGYLSPAVLKSLPVATTVGNHDADNPNYTYHFNTPNSSELGSNGIVGGDYWFTYGSALFMMLNTQDTNVADHKAFIEQAVEANPNCKWRIVTLHQDIYGSAEHSNEPEITNLRYQLVPYFEENKVDVVLTGHDHAYSRSQILKGGIKTVEYDDDSFDTQLDKDMDAGENPSTLYTAPGNIADNTADAAEQTYLNYLNAVMDKDAVQAVKTENEAVINPTGILYMTANSSSGSKYYDLVPRMQNYIANRWQEDIPTYSIVNITDSTFSISSYRTDNGEKIDDTFTIAKVTVDKSGLANLIHEVKQNIVPNKSAYTAESYQVLEQALNGAEQVNSDETAVNSEVQAAIQALTSAQAALVKILEAPAASDTSNTADTESGKIAKSSVKAIKDQAYTGKKLKPSVTVTVNGKKLKSGTDYKVSYSNNQKIGTAKVTITGQGSYTGKVTVSFKIVPKKISLKSVKSEKSKTVKVKFSAGSGSLSGYQIKYATNSKFTKAKTVSTKKTTITLKSLKKGKTCYVKVRGYKKVSGKTYYGAYSTVKKVRVK